MSLSGKMNAMAKRTYKKSAEVARHGNNTAAVPHVIHHRDGSLYARGQMLDGQMHGFWSFFRKDGSIMRSGYFDRGVQTGTWTTYGNDGRPVKVTDMKPKPVPGVKEPATKETTAKTAARKAAAKRVAAMAARPRRAVAKPAVRKPTKETTRAAKR